MTTPPNYRRVECCGNCINFGVFFSCDGQIDRIECEKHHCANAGNICDDYEPGDGE